MREHGPVCTRGQKTREGAASAVRNWHDGRIRSQLHETQELFDADKRHGWSRRLARWRAGTTRFIPTPFPVAARRTGRADFPHPALSGIMPSPTEGRASAQTGARGATDCRALIVGVAVSPLAAHRAPPAQPLVGPFAVQSAASLLTAADPAPALPPVGRYMLDSLLRFRMWCLGELFDPCRRPRRNASIACRSLLPAPFPDQWSFPPPALPGLIGTTTPSATPRGRLRASRHNRWPAPLRQPPPGASRVAHGPSTRMPSPLPRRNRWVRTSFSFPNGGGLPRISGGSASALPFSRPAQRSLLVTACALAESLTDPFTSEASSASLPPRTFRLLPAGTTLAGWDLHPLRPCTFARRTEKCGLVPRASVVSRIGLLETQDHFPH